MNHICKLYDRIYKNYRIINSILTLSLDKYWRKKTVEHIMTIKPSAVRILDICCGTGDLTKLIRKSFPQADIYGIDANVNMLSLAKQELPDVKFVDGYVSDMPFDNDFFDIVVISFASRNLFFACDFKKSVNEVKRVIKPGGFFVSVETALYDNYFLNLAMKIYISFSIGMLNFLMPSSANSYNFLKSSILKFDILKFKSEIEKHFVFMRCRRLFPGSVAICWALKS
ncbi:MAG: class I SAM-dependent methyltransferase [Elusimicrobiota bacterium]